MAQDKSPVMGLPGYLKSVFMPEPASLPKYHVFTAADAPEPEVQPAPQTAAHVVSPQGVSFIHHYEKCRLKAYLDAGGKPTIGWGDTAYEDGRPVKMGDVITQDRADKLFALDLDEKTTTVLRLIRRPLLQWELDAAVSFCYNAGTGYKSGKDFILYNLWKHIQSNLSGDAMRKYWESLAITANGVKMNGLVRRRKSEALLYLTGEINYFE